MAIECGYCEDKVNYVINDSDYVAQNYAELICKVSEIVNDNKYSNASPNFSE